MAGSWYQDDMSAAEAVREKETRGVERVLVNWPGDGVGVGLGAAGNGRSSKGVPKE